MFYNWDYIVGCSFGFEFFDDDDHLGNYLILDLFIFRLLISEKDIDS